jgi:hypothetical protein
MYDSLCRNLLVTLELGIADARQLALFARDQVDATRLQEVIKEREELLALCLCMSTIAMFDRDALDDDDPEVDGVA